MVDLKIGDRVIISSVKGKLRGIIIKTWSDGVPLGFEIKLDENLARLAGQSTGRWFYKNIKLEPTNKVKLKRKALW